MTSPKSPERDRSTVIDGNLRLNAAAYSSCGKGRENNEDAIYMADDLSLFIVADGIGGANAGEVASHTAIEEFLTQTAKWPRHGSDAEYKELIDDALHAASNLIHAMGRDVGSLWGAGTTMTLGFRLHDHMFVVSVGDSRAYRLRGNQFQQLAIDDSWVEILVRAGAITREQAKNHPNRNVILSSLGSKDFSEEHPEVGVMELLDGDRFVLCSDGLHDALRDDEVREILADEEPLESIVSRLVELAVDKGSQDDISCIVLEVANKERTEDGVIERSIGRIRGFFSPTPKIRLNTAN
ncbi:MAG: protein phosphatase 2C domain-containing protein [Planctomycetota bacterium]|nr:protein phosphatase 2C domain-containing protein [Planctomycetota bacterium]